MNVFKSSILALAKNFRKCSNRIISYKIGDTAELTKTFTKEDVSVFAQITGDSNPIHQDEDFAKSSLFGRPIVHGVLVNGLISAVLGTKLPGPGTAVLSQELKFLSPLYIGEPVTARIEISKMNRRLVQCQAICFVPARDKIILTGTVKLLAPSGLDLNSHETS
ncbi:hydroxyacyl-thioester dehydratase type 2, mitochondrial [Lingula anatina]|uniref:Hydroxyacyl-thioester dehydratase type 2, mitochondrial n=1 Tax=Lingula anatina TaxID=7574 RepID=A0A1S3J8H8_LINAN|nr:hydroxyacyl-thioester dehydratase type 2, mitochondrial [Lingula anatina]|eukprot:XP_013406707.1 hydroxyacyl-thioester dehydratase type 2, mitochondrial [Lingula anatina]